MEAIGFIKNKKFGYNCDKCRITPKRIVQTEEKMFCPECAVKNGIVIPENVEWEE